MLKPHDAPIYGASSTSPPALDWLYRAKATASPISLHHQDVIDEGSTPGRSIWKTHEKENFVMPLHLLDDACPSKCLVDAGASTIAVGKAP